MKTASDGCVPVAVASTAPARAQLRVSCRELLRPRPGPRMFAADEPTLRDCRGRHRAGQRMLLAAGSDDELGDGDSDRDDDGIDRPVLR